MLLRTTQNVAQQEGYINLSLKKEQKKVFFAWFREAHDVFKPRKNLQNTTKNSLFVLHFVCKLFLNMKPDKIKRRLFCFIARFTTWLFNKQTQTVYNY